MTWLNLTMPNQTVKYGLKAKKIKLPQINFFLEKQLVKFWCTYLPLSFCKILKKFQTYEDVPFSGPKWAICPEHFFFLLALFIVENLNKFLQQIQSYEDVLLFGPKRSIFPTNFFWKIVKIILIYLLGPFIVQNFKKIIPVDPELWGCTIFGPKIAHFSKWEFLQKTC